MHSQSESCLSRSSPDDTPTPRKLTGELGYPFQCDYYGERLAGALRVYPVKGDFRRLGQLELPVRARGLQTPFTHDGDEFLRQTAIVSLDARYPHPGAVLVVGGAVLQRVRSACEEDAALRIATARDNKREGRGRKGGREGMRLSIKGVASSKETFSFFR